MVPQHMARITVMMIEGTGLLAATRVFFVSRFRNLMSWPFGALTALSGAGLWGLAIAGLIAGPH